MRRTHYLAHPRHNGQVVRRLDNEDDVYAAVERHAQQSSSGMRLVNGDFARMSLKAQVGVPGRAATWSGGVCTRGTPLCCCNPTLLCNPMPQVEAAQNACLIVGAHGAGLSHVLFAPPGVHVLELRTPAFRRPHFIAYAYWSGAHHHDWSLETSTPAPNQVVQRVAETLAEADRMEHSAH